MAEKSGLYYPNILPHIYLTTVQEIIGVEAVEAVLKLADLPELVGNYPPSNMSREFDFVDFAAIGAALEKMYGVRGERGLGLYAGKVCFHQGVNQLASIAGLSELAFKAVSFNTKIKIGLKAMAETFTGFSDQLTSLTEDEEYFIYTIHRCPVCWGRSSQKPICYVALAIIETGLQWLSDGHYFEVEEVTCCAMGDEACVFHIRKEPSN
jgi:predicted hydrocarbon binding protein